MGNFVTYATDCFGTVGGSLCRMSDRGWFKGIATNLHPLPSAEAATRLLPCGFSVHLTLWPIGVMIMQMKLTYPLVLASASVRRRQLLSDAGYEFDVVEPTVDEPVNNSAQGCAAAYWAEAMAYIKACSVAQAYKDAIIIGADTVVTHGNNIIGKAKDETHAREILSTMFGGKNEVITGLAVLCPACNKRIITHVSTILIMRPMNTDEVDQYIQSGAWQGKAGAYALQEGGDKFVQSIQGSESNIIGLPMEKLEEILSGFCKRT